MEHLENHQRPNATIVAGPRDAGRTYLAAHPNPFETLTVAELPATWRVVIARHLGEADRRRSVTLKREARVRPTPVSGRLLLLSCASSHRVGNVTRGFALALAER